MWHKSAHLYCCVETGDTIPVIIDTTDTDTDTYIIDIWFLACSIRYLIKLTWCIVLAGEVVAANIKPKNVDMIFFLNKNLE